MIGACRVHVEFALLILNGHPVYMPDPIRYVNMLCEHCQHS